MQSPDIDDSTQNAMPQALVLCGGLGMRLRSAYDSGPKALAPVAGRPFLAYLMEWLRRQGVRSVLLCVGYRAEQILDQFPAGSGDPRIAYSVEPEPLGTGGALKHAESRIHGDRFFVLNGDSLADVSLADLLAFHRARGASATLATVPVAVAGRYGSVDIDAAGRVLGFREKAAAAPGIQPVNSGVYVMERELLEQIPGACAVSLERTVFPALAGRSLFAFQTNGSFIDIGVPEDLSRAQTEIPGRLPA